jgi:isoamylase
LRAAYTSWVVSARLAFAAALFAAGCRFEDAVPARPDAAARDGGVSVDAERDAGAGEDAAIAVSDASRPNEDAGAIACTTVSGYPPLGARHSDDHRALELRVYSARATRIVADLFAAPFGEDEKLSVELERDGATNVWFGAVAIEDLIAAGIGETIYYGYRAWGPNWPYDPAWTKGSTVGFAADVDADGNRFNPNKLLIDPYALELSHDLLNARHRDGSVYRVGAAGRAIDDGHVIAKGVVLPREPVECFDKPERDFKDAIIYEVHVRGFTKNDQTLPEELRGTYAGAARKAA